MMEITISYEEHIKEIANILQYLVENHSVEGKFFKHSFELDESLIKEDDLRAIELPKNVTWYEIDGKMTFETRLDGKPTGRRVFFLIEKK